MKTIEDNFKEIGGDFSDSTLDAFWSPVRNGESSFSEMKSSEISNDQKKEITENAVKWMSKLKIMMSQIDEIITKYDKKLQKMKLSVETVYKFSMIQQQNQ